MGFAVVMLLGPHKDEIVRTQDLLDSIQSFSEPEIHKSDLYIVNDGNSRVNILRSNSTFFRNTFFLSNPLTGKPTPILDRHVAGMLYGLRHVVQKEPYDFVLKVDTDALVINQFYERILAFFRKNPNAGMVGSYIRFPDGSKRPGIEWWAPRVEKVYLIDSNSQRAFRRRKIIRAAKRNGYIYGHHVLGGSYALSANLLREWKRRSMFRNVSLFQGTNLGEDVVVSLLVKTAGFKMMDFNKEGEVFGTWFKQLRFTPDELLSKQYAIIHSLKTFINYQNEIELRKLFKNKREEGRGV